MNTRSTVLPGIAHGISAFFVGYILILILWNFKNPGQRAGSWILGAVELFYISHLGNPSFSLVPIPVRASTEPIWNRILESAVPIVILAYNGRAIAKANSQSTARELFVAVMALALGYALCATLTLLGMMFIFGTIPLFVIFIIIFAVGILNPVIFSGFSSLIIYSLSADS